MYFSSPEMNYTKKKKKVSAKMTLDQELGRKALKEVKIIQQSCKELTNTDFIISQEFLRDRSKCQKL